MKTPVSQVRLLLLVLGVLTALLLGGCKRPAGFFQRSVSRPHPRTITRPAPAPDLGQQALETVHDYLQALQDRNFATAYDMLSRASQSRHSRASFEKQGKQGMPLFDLKSARVMVVKDDTATVHVGLLEDPATHAFQLVLQRDEWKIVYRGGSPGMPYAD